MRDFVRNAAVCLLVLCALAFTTTADAAQRTRQRKIKGERPRQAEAYSLEDIMKSPKEFQEREVMFYARFATTANLFKQINTRFTPNAHVNLAVWPDKSVLWTAEGRKNVLPTLYIAKNDTENLAVLREVKKYELLAFTGQVQNVYAGYPWILVTKIEKMEKPSEKLIDRVIEHMQAGIESLDAGSGGAAAQHFEQALQFGLPVEYRDAAYKQLAQAYLLENKLDRARGYLRQAVETNRNDPRLHLALADVCLQMDDAGEALAHATFALEQSGKYPQAYGIRGESMSLLGDYAGAFNDLNTAAGTPGITPREKAVIQLRRARIYARSDRPADAARIYAALSEPGEILSGDPNVHNEIGLFYEGLFLQSADPAYLESAMAAFGEAANLATLNPIYLYNQAEVEFRRQRMSDAPDMRKVLEIIERISQIDPDYAPARLLLGRVYFQQEKTAEAEEIYQALAPHLENDSMALLALAEAYMELGRYEDAIVAVQSAREVEPWNRRLQAIGRHVENIANSQLELALAEKAAAEAKIAAEQAAIAAQEAAERAAITAREAADHATRTAREAAEQAISAQRAADEAAEEAAAEEAEPMAPAVVEEYLEDETVTYDKYYLDEGEYIIEEEVVDVVEESVPFKPFVAEPQARKNTLRPPVAGARVSPEPLNLGRKLDKELVALDGTGTGAKSRNSAMREPSGAKRERLPMTRVELPKAFPPPLDLGYTPGERDLLPELVTDEFAAEFEEAAEDVRNGGEQEAVVDSDGYLQFGMMDRAIDSVASTAAYASVVVPGAGSVAPVSGGDDVRIPPVFTFAPDTSPVLISDVRSQAVPGRRQLVRNANLYKRRNGNGRRPAEIIEREPVAPHTAQDAAAMVGPRGGAAPRAEIRLPSSSLGIGRVRE